MANPRNFMHLPLPLKYKGTPKLRGFSKPDDRTKDNKVNRTTHGATIKRRAGELSRFWRERRDNRDGLPEIKVGIPFLLEIDPTSEVEFLRGLGFEIICSLHDGFIVVASEDTDLKTFNNKTDGFINNISSRCNTPAKVYALCEDTDRLSLILTPGFQKIWDILQDEETYTVDISVSCSGTIPLPDKPKQEDGEDEAHYNDRIARWQRKFDQAFQQWDDIAYERQEEIISFMDAYQGEIVSSFINENDSFSFKLRIIGKGLRDFVLNYPYIFEVSEPAEVQMETSSATEGEPVDEIEIVAPDETAPIICVIDSGIQEAHKYVSPAIISGDSISLIPKQPGVGDEVAGGGHGTRVAGAILYPDQIPISGVYKLPNFIRNVRVLDNNNSMMSDIEPAEVILDVTKRFTSPVATVPSNVFNHSIGENKPFTDIAHMSAWAAQIDKQSYENDILFVQSAGNISEEMITALIKAGHPYPDYIGHEFSRLSNPAQSLQALTVGSVSENDYETEDIIAMGKRGDSSSYSRIGPGIWDTIKPDVVEYGGTHAINKAGTDVRLTTPSEVCPELLRRSPPGKAYDRDVVGTSFSSPKVAHIASEIEKILPDSPALLYRALIAQSARWFDLTNVRDRENTIRRIGFGLPDIQRATHNDEYRVTLLTPNISEIGEREAHVYSIKIPDELKAVGDEYDVLIEVTLSYAANPRRTRRYIKGYLSTWVDWISSRRDEEPDTFAKRIFDTGSSIDDGGNFNWMLGESRGKGKGQISEFSRSKGTLQKDWCIIKSNQLTEEFCIAVRGHEGWGGRFKAKYSLAVSFEAINQDIAIYEPIRIANEVELETPEIDLEVKSSNE